MASQVTYTNLLSESRNNVVDLITTTNVPDPISSSKEFRKMIYSRPPDVKATDFKGYPLIIVNPTDIDVEREEGSGDGKHRFVNFNISVEIRSSDVGFGNNNAKGLQHLDSISNDIIETFLDLTNRNTLINNQMEYIDPDIGVVETIPEADELIYRRVITLQFRSRLAISK